MRELFLEAKAKHLYAESDEYKEFFQKALDKFGVESPADLGEEEKKKFFKYVDDNWESESEK